MVTAVTVTVFTEEVDMNNDVDGGVRPDMGRDADLPGEILRLTGERIKACRE